MLFSFFSPLIFAAGRFLYVLHVPYVPYTGIVNGRRR